MFRASQLDGYSFVQYFPSIPLYLVMSSGLMTCVCQMIGNILREDFPLYPLAGVGHWVLSVNALLFLVAGVLTAFWGILPGQGQKPKLQAAVETLFCAAMMVTVFVSVVTVYLYL